jgi:hypothetical protein
MVMTAPRGCSPRICSKSDGCHRFNRPGDANAA